MGNRNNFNVRLLLVLMAFLPQMGHSQFTSHRVGLNIAPALTKNYSSDLDASSPFYRERSMFIGGSFGFSMLHDFGSKFQLQTDILMSTYNDHTSYDVGGEIHPEHGFILGNEPRTAVEINEYQTLSIPVLVNYYLNDNNKWRMYISGGIKGHLFIARYHSRFIKGDPIETYEENRSQVAILGDSRYRTITMSAQMGFGFDYQKSEKTLFRIAPYYEHFVLNTLRNNPNQERSYTLAAGVSLGVYWK